MNMEVLRCINLKEFVGHELCVTVIITDQRLLKLNQFGLVLYFIINLRLSRPVCWVMILWKHHIGLLKHCSCWF